MILTLIRYKSDANKTLGRLYIDGNFECYTLEDEYRVPKVAGETRIPSGSYRLDLRFSPKFTPKYGHNMLWIKDVKGFEFILIHKGNTDIDTAGCVLVGSGTFQNGLISSKKAYDLLYPKVSKEIISGRPTWITIIDQDRQI